MEHMGVVDFEGEWSGMCSDEADFMAQLLADVSFPNNISMYSSRDTTHPSLCFDETSLCHSGDDPRQFLPSQPECKKRSRIPQNRVNISNKKSSSSSSCCSEDDSINASNGKTRASRGSATDPQSLYARKRREKINERLKTLQKLVPNGTKVDISTMLEEAVDYVKFLQHQIKLLSSDDLWMYAPIATMGWDKLPR